MEKDKLYFEPSTIQLVELSKATQRCFILDVDKIVLKEKGVELLSATVEEFISQFDKLVFKGKDGEETVFEKK